MISSIMNLQTTSFDNGNDLPYVLFLPSYAATAWYHSRFGSVGRQYAEMLVCMRTYKDITFLACAYIAETA